MLNAKPMRMNMSTLAALFWGRGVGASILQAKLGHVDISCWEFQFGQVCKFGVWHCQPGGWCRATIVRDSWVLKMVSIKKNPLLSLKTEGLTVNIEAFCSLFHCVENRFSYRGKSSIFCQGMPLAQGRPFAAIPKTGTEAWAWLWAIPRHRENWFLFVKSWEKNDFATSAWNSLPLFVFLFRKDSDFFFNSLLPDLVPRKVGRQNWSQIRVWWTGDWNVLKPTCL